jgi:hypothetical protein
LDARQVDRDISALIATFFFNILYLQQAFMELSPVVEAVRIASMFVGLASEVILLASLQPPISHAALVCR